MFHRGRRLGGGWGDVLRLPGPDQTVVSSDSLEWMKQMLCRNLEKLRDERGCYAHIVDLQTGNVVLAEVTEPKDLSHRALRSRFICGND